MIIITFITYNHKNNNKTNNKNNNYDDDNEIIIANFLRVY